MTWVDRRPLQSRFFDLTKDDGGTKTGFSIFGLCDGWGLIVTHQGALTN